MSRCFPYPPPGFEPPIDLLNKEKRKDKKHKKDKKEKREGKEKHRDKDRKDKKDKKEKHKHKNRDKDKDKIRSTDKTLQDSRFVDELAKRVGDGSQPASQFTDKRERKPVPVPVPVPVPNSVPSAQKRNDELVKPGPISQKPSHHFTDSVERREKKSVPVPVPVPNSVAQRKNDELARPGSTNHNNNRATTSFNEKRVGQVSQEEGSNSKRTIQNSANPNFRNPSFTNNANAPNSSSKNLNSTNHASSSNPNSKSPNLSLQRKSNGPATQINNNNQHSTGISDRKVVPNEIKKPVPLPAPVPNSSQTRTNGTISNQKFATNHSAPQIDRKIDGPTKQIGLNNQLSGEKREREKVEREKEGKKEKRKETTEEREKRKEEKKRKKKEEKKQRKKEEKEREKAKQREKANLVGINNKPGLLEGSQRNIEKIGGGLNEVSNKRKEMESNGFLHEDEMRAQKLLKTDQFQKRKDDLTNGFLHENEAGPTKLNKKLPLYPPPQNGKIHSSHTPSPIKPPISTTNYNNTLPDSKITKINNKTTKLDVNKTPQLSNGTVSDAKGDLVINKKGKEDSSSKRSKRKEREESKESKPHRDLKYLSVVYSVPKLNEDELLPQDDQEWLIKRNPNSKNPNPNSERVVGETSEVWDRAVRIESADLIALPYVIPF